MFGHGVRSEKLRPTYHYVEGEPRQAIGPNVNHRRSGDGLQLPDELEQMSDGRLAGEDTAPPWKQPRAVLDECHHAYMGYRRHPNRIAAQAAGAIRWTGPECPTHGAVERFVKNGNCVICQRTRAREAKRRESARLEPYREARRAAIAARASFVPLREQLARLAAIEAGEMYWHGPWCPRGHDGLRYVKNNRCVQCNRESARAG